MSDIMSEWIQYIPEQKEHKESVEKQPTVLFGSTISFNRIAAELIPDVYDYKFAVILQRYDENNKLVALAVQLQNEQSFRLSQITNKKSRSGFCGFKTGTPALMKSLLRRGFRKGTYVVHKLNDNTLAFNLEDRISEETKASK